MNCYRCGKCVTDKDGVTVLGMAITTNVEDKRHEFMKKQVGKYEAGRTYGFCYECLLDVFLARKERRMRQLVKCNYCGLYWMRIVPMDCESEIVLNADIQYSCPKCGSNWYDYVDEKVAKAIEESTHETN